MTPCWRLQLWGFLQKLHESSYGVVANVSDCNIVVASSNSSLAITFTFGLIPLGEVGTSLYPYSHRLNRTSSVLKLLLLRWVRKKFRGTEDMSIVFFLTTCSLFSNSVRKNTGSDPSAQPAGSFLLLWWGRLLSLHGQTVKFFRILKTITQHFRNRKYVGISRSFVPFSASRLILT